MRSVVTPLRENAGTFFCGDDRRWYLHPLTLVHHAIAAKGFTAKEAQELIGSAVARPWVRVSLPFKPEFPGNRQWNAGAAQLRVTPSEGPTPHWDRILDHAGQSLTRYLVSPLRAGADYLRAIFASILRFPFEPLPYCFFFGPENSGKSIIWEAFELLVSGGVVKADRALTSKNDFNGELANAILCVIEERDISRTPGALTKLKDAVTSRTLSIRRMRCDAYTQPNTTHWMQFANDPNACPIFPGDTRITMIHVPALPNGAEIPKAKLMAALAAEAPAFLHQLLTMELPEPSGRLRVAIIETAHKAHIQEINRDPLEQFLTQECHRIDGAMIIFKDFWERFQAWLSPEDRYTWTKQMVTKRLPIDLPTGTHAANKKAIGNLSFNLREPGAPFVCINGRLRPAVEQTE